VTKIGIFLSLETKLTDFLFLMENDFFRVMYLISKALGLVVILDFSQDAVS
jgi:hypothetical protein